jgi:hypothetical protein
MPVESRAGTDQHTPDSVGAAYITEARRTLAEAMAKIANCLDQLADDDLWWRPFESHNSIENIVLHLCGNVRQWIVSAIGGVPDTRNRPAEFSERRAIPKAELLARLRQTVAEADAALAVCPIETLLAPIRVQGFDATKLSAIFDSVSHFVGHTHQIVYITRLRLGDRYRFGWTPSKEQGG